MLYARNVEAAEEGSVGSRRSRRGRRRYAPLSADFVRRIDDDQMSLHSRRAAPPPPPPGSVSGDPPRGRSPALVPVVEVDLLAALAGDEAPRSGTPPALRRKRSENLMTRQARDDLQLAQRLGEEELVAHRAAPPPPPGGEEKEVKVAMRTPPPPPPREPVEGPSEMALRRLSGAAVSHRRAPPPPE